MSTTPKFQPGDVVRLNGDTVWMTVEAVDLVGNVYRCHLVWFTREPNWELRRTTLAEHVLTPIPAEALPRPPAPRRRHTPHP